MKLLLGHLLEGDLVHVSLDLLRLQQVRGRTLLEVEVGFNHVLLLLVLQRRRLVEGWTVLGQALAASALFGGVLVRFLG